MEFRVPDDKIILAALGMSRQCWEQGIFAQALMETGEKDLCRFLVNDIVLRQRPDGLLGDVENTPAWVDTAFCVPAVLYISREDGNEKYLAAAERCIDFLRTSLPKGPSGGVFQIIGMTSVWADSLAFLPCVLAEAGYVCEAMEQLRIVKDLLCDPGSGLYYHMWDDEKKAYERKVFWGIGEGWVLTSLVRTFAELEKKDVAYTQEKEWLRSEYASVLSNVLRFETADHRFHDVLDDPDTYLETETSYMTVYSMYRAAELGMTGSEYVGRADRIMDAAEEQIDDDGYVNNCSSSPAFDRPGRSTECQAHALMARAARRRLEGERK